MLPSLSEPCTFRYATTNDVPALVSVETACFRTDRLSKRRFQHWVVANNGLLLIAEDGDGIQGYGLVLLLGGTRLARLYSLAIIESARGKGLSRRILERLEQDAAAQGRIFMRLEVETGNEAAIHLYKRMGYQVFGEYSDYYEDHGDALRMQKRIRSISREHVGRSVVWYQQTTDFTCGPAALMMGMHSLNSAIAPSQPLELDLWREATTIFMTSGHGGCHPVGLAVAASKRGFKTKVYLNTDKPLFTDSVRSTLKKNILCTVDQQFHERAQEHQVDVIYAEIQQQQIQHALTQGAAVLVLISTYRLDGRKSPHWVTVTAIDDRCLYVHDPDLDEKTQVPLDCQHVPIARADFVKMSAFGSQRLRTAIIIYPMPSVE